MRLVGEKNWGKFLPQSLRWQERAVLLWDICINPSAQNVWLCSDKKVTCCKNSFSIGKHFSILAHCFKFKYGADLSSNFLYTSQEFLLSFGTSAIFLRDLENDDDVEILLMKYWLKSSMCCIFFNGFTWTNLLNLYKVLTRKELLISELYLEENWNM